MSNYYNKQDIKQRMHRLATNHFGMSRTELLDPVVILFLESLAEEIYKISGEIDQMEHRILEKLSGILVPHTDSIAKPAHAILHTAALEDTLQITTQTAFCYTDSDNGKQNKFSFYPVCNTQIYKGDIRYFIHERLLHTIDHDQTKTLVTRSHYKKPFPNHSFWIGIELEQNIENLVNLSFYFDFPGISNKDEYLNMLPYTVWKIQGDLLPMRKGIFSTPEEYENHSLELFSIYNYSNRINNSVKKYYDKHFLTVKDHFKIVGKKEIFPEALHTYFHENKSDSLNRPLLWIEINCPPGITPEIVNTMQISINAFPVVNKKLISKTMRIEKTMPIIPMHTKSKESFISVCSLIDSNGKVYYDIPVKDNENTAYGIYSLRRGGCERYTIRDSMEYLTHSIAKLNGEISSFLRNKNDIKSELKKIQSEVNDLIKQLNKTISVSKERYEVAHYILISPEKNNETYFIEYWVTNGAAANHIKAGKALVCTSESQVHPSSIVLLSQTSDGKYTPQTTIQNTIYKKSLSKHSLLVTNDDIIDFCMNEFKDSFTHVALRRGLVKNNDPRIGFTKTTDVYMKPHKELENYFDNQSVAYFEKILKEHSPETYKYRVFIKKT